MLRTNADRSWCSSSRRPWTAPALAVALLIGVSTATAQSPPDGAAPDRTTSAETDERVTERLESTIVDADYRGVDFDEIVDDLRREHDLNFYVSWHDLESRDIRRDRRLEVRLNRVSLATLLTVVLRELSTDGYPVRYQVEGGVIMISTDAALDRDTVLRTYDVTDLLESGYARRRFANTPVLSLELTGREFVGGERETAEGEARGGGGYGGGGSLFGEPVEAGSRMERVQAIVDLIQEHVDPDGWFDNGGEIGSVSELNGVLLIQQSLRNHRRIDAFLEQVRANRPRPLDADAIIVRIRADRAAAWRRSIGDGFPRLPRAAVDEFLLSEDAEGVLFRGVTSGFGGQRVWFSALTQRDVLTGSAPVVATQSNAFEPQTGFTTEGLELIVLPLLAPGSDQLTLDVQMAWVPPVEVTDRPVALASAIPALEPGKPATATLDQTKRSMRSVSTTARLRLGDGLALTIPHEIAPNASEWEEWLIVRVRGR